MPTFVRISNGVVAEPAIELPNGVSTAAVFSPGLVFADVSSLSSPPAPGSIAMETNGAWTFSAPPVPVPSVDQVVANAIAAGCLVTSASIPAINGTYALDDGSRADINAIVTYISVNGKFPAGIATLEWPDTSNVMHPFATTASFTAFASAIADYVMKLTLFAKGVITQPANSETIP